MHRGVPTQHTAQGMRHTRGQGCRTEVRARQVPAPGWTWADGAPGWLPDHWLAGSLGGWLVARWLAGWLDTWMARWLVAHLARELASWLPG